MCKACEKFMEAFDAGRLNHLLPDNDNAKWAMLYSAVYSSILGNNPEMLVIAGTLARVTPDEALPVIQTLMQEHRSFYIDEGMPEKARALGEVIEKVGVWLAMFKVEYVPIQGGGNPTLN